MMEMAGPKDIVLYWSGPRAFSVVQKPPPPGGMVTGQIDTCITLGNLPHNLYWT